MEKKVVKIVFLIIMMSVLILGTSSFAESNTDLQEKNEEVAANVTDSAEENASKKVTGVKLNKNSLSLEVGEEQTLKATITPENADDKTVTWSSNDSKIATVDGGKVTAVSEGEAVIKVKTKDGEYEASCNVIVNEKSNTLKEEAGYKIITFKDENLYKAIVETLGNQIKEKGNNQIKISEENLKKVTKLILENKEIEDLSGIENFTEVKMLHVSYNNIKDITCLKSMKNLYDLYLSCNKISDITPLKSLDNLGWLSLGTNNLDKSDLKVLEEMTNEGKLDNLVGLWLFNFNINSLDEISFIFKLKDKLGLLDLHSNNLSDVSALEEFDQISTLYIYDNKIADATPIKNMLRLGILNMANQKIEIHTDRAENYVPILEQAFNYFEATEARTSNCSVSEDKATVTIEDTSKRAVVLIKGGKMSETTITFIVDGTTNPDNSKKRESDKKDDTQKSNDNTKSTKPLSQAGTNLTIVFVIAAGLVLAVIGFAKNKKYKSIK